MAQPLDLVSGRFTGSEVLNDRLEIVADTEVKASQALKLA